MESKAARIITILLNYLIGGVLIATGIMKLLEVEEYVKMLMELHPNYVNNLSLIGTVGVVSGVFFIIPRTFTYGFVSVLVYFGGTISAHMQHGDPFIAQVVFVLLTIAVAHLRHPEWFNGRKGRLTQ
jgi:hypothetical protein